MYNKLDYIKRGAVVLNNKLRPHKKILSSVMLYSTDRCNSRCKHCFIWDKKPNQHLPLEKIKEILKSPAVHKGTNFGIEGGEFILHPEAEQILEYFSKNHPNFDVLSNAISYQKLIRLIKKYPPRRLYMSLDGDQETYKFMRGVDTYDRVLKVVEELKDVVPISLMFTLSPFNTFEDLKHVANICKEHQIDMRIGIYNSMEYFETHKNDTAKDSLSFDINEIPDEASEFNENYDFLALFQYHKQKKLQLSCNSIKDSIVIYPNGDIPICQNKHLVLGNVFKEELHQIINKPSTVELHKKYQHNCNECWINYHRKFDIVLFRNLEKVLPKKVIESFFGKYQWTDNPKTKYADIFAPQKD